MRQLVFFAVIIISLFVFSFFSYAESTDTKIHPKEITQCENIGEFFQTVSYVFSVRSPHSPFPLFFETAHLRFSDFRDKQGRLVCKRAFHAETNELFWQTWRDENGNFFSYVTKLGKIFSNALTQPEIFMMYPETDEKGVVSFYAAVLLRLKEARIDPVEGFVLGNLIETHIYTFLARPFVHPSVPDDLKPKGPPPLPV